MRRLSDNRSFDLAERVYAGRVEAAEGMLAGASAFARRECPVCGHDDGEIRDVFGYEVTRCGRCLTDYVGLCPTPAQLAGFYNSSLISELNREIWQRDRTREFQGKLAVISTLVQEKITPIVELGSGPGQFVSFLNRNGYDNVVGIDVDKEACDIGVQNGVDVRNIDLTKDAAPAAGLYLLYEVIEHLFDPKAFLRSLWSQMPAGSALVLTTPNADGADNVTIPATQSGRFIASAIFPPYHINAFSVKGLFHLALDLDYEVVDISTPGGLDLEMIRHHTSMLSGLPADASSEEMVDVFQGILADSKGSGHLQAVLRKPNDAGGEPRRPEKAG